MASPDCAYQMRQDIALSRKAIEDELNRKKAKKAIADALTPQYKNGNGLLGYSPFLVFEDLKEWRELTHKWSVDVYSQMKALDCTQQELVAFDSIHLPDVPFVVVDASDLENMVERQKAGFGVRVGKLGQIIDSYLEVPILRVKP